MSEHVQSGTFAEAKKRIEAIKAEHPGLASLFHRDVGLALQRLDSEMCRDVLTEMVVERHVTILPVHDRFIVPSSAAMELADVMETVFDRVAGQGNIPDFGDSSVGYRKTILHLGGFLTRLRAGPSSSGAADSDSSPESKAESKRNHKGAKIRGGEGRRKGSGGETSRFSRIKTRSVSETIAEPLFVAMECGSSNALGTEIGSLARTAPRTVSVDPATFPPAAPSS